MSHMPTYLQPTMGGGNRLLGTFLYVATGLEGVDFRVAHNLALSSGYVVQWSPEGMSAIPVTDLPNATGDRTTNDLRVLVNGPLTAGDKMRFNFFAYGVG